MLLTDLMKKVQNIEPTAELRSYGIGRWVLEASTIGRNGKSRVTVLAKFQTKTVTYKGSVVNEVVNARTLPNTERRRAIKTWLALWGVPLK